MEVDINVGNLFRSSLYITQQDNKVQKSELTNTEEPKWRHVKGGSGGGVTFTF
jgi:hypothetical protein